MRSERIQETWSSQVSFLSRLPRLPWPRWLRTYTNNNKNSSPFFQHLQPLSSISVMLGNTLRSWSEWMDPSIACTCGCASLCICPSGYSQPISSQTACCGLLVSHEQPCTVSSISSYSITVITREIILFLFCSNFYRRSDNSSLGGGGGGKKSCLDTLKEMYCVYYRGEVGEGYVCCHTLSYFSRFIHSMQWIPMIGDVSPYEKQQILYDLIFKCRL